MRPLLLALPLSLACRQEDPPRDTAYGVHVALEEGIAGVDARVQALEGEVASQAAVSAALASDLETCTTDVAALSEELSALQEQVAELQAQMEARAAEGGQ